MEGGDHDDPLSILSLQDNDELLAIKKISKYFPDSPLEEHIHILVEPPVSTATSSREQELFDHWRKRLINQPMVCIK
jgi:hypothetical protein